VASIPIDVGSKRHAPLECEGCILASRRCADLVAAREYRILRLADRGVQVEVGRESRNPT